MKRVVKEAISGIALIGSIIAMIVLIHEVETEVKGIKNDPVPLV